MDHSTFSGFPAFLERAAKELGLGTSHARTTPPTALAAMANLCAQASTAGPARAPAILKEAATFRDRLLVAARAAELMLDEMERASMPGAGPAPVPTPAPQPRHNEDPGRPRPIRPSNRPTTHRP
ncbi:MAG TPA: hypothetical protein VGH33_02660 [Isosphaeraceae bacterium]